MEGEKWGHVIFGLQILFIYFGYHIAPAIRWDPQTQNGGWVEPGALGSFWASEIASLVHLWPSGK